LGCTDATNIALAEQVTDNGQQLEWLLEAVTSLRHLFHHHHHHHHHGICNAPLYVINSGVTRI